MSMFYVYILEIPEDAAGGRAAGVRKPVSFKLALANTWWLLKLKVNIYHFVCLILIKL